MSRQLSIVLPGLLALGLLVTGALQEVRAQSVVSTDQVTASLRADVSTAAPGETFRVALHQEIIPGWHSYWRNPGDSGQETALFWDLPDDVAVSDIRWPAPSRIPYGPLMNYGYKDTATLLVDVTLAADWPAGEPLPLKADAEWLVCEEICIPQYGSFALDVPTGAQTQASADQAELFAAAEQAMPVDAGLAAQFARSDQALEVQIELPGDPARITDAYLFPLTWGVIDHAAAQELRAAEGGVRLSATAGEIAPETPLEAVLEITEDTGGTTLTRAYTISAAPGSLAPVSDALLATGAGEGGGTFASIGLIAALALAFAGGVLLNLMPCVFPILTMKGLSLLRHGDGPGAQRLAGGLAYTAGVLASFLALGAGLLALKATGAAVGWGFQLQEPIVVGALSLIMLAVGLNLSGVFEVTGAFGTSGGSARSGLAGDFFTGVLATVVAAPCTAPFMASAMGAALVLPAAAGLAVFAMLGLGLAAPFLALSAFPQLAARLPRPGAWMDELKQILAFPMYAACAWLVWVAAQQTGPQGLLILLMALIAIGFAAWLYGFAQRKGDERLLPRRALAALGICAAIASLGALREDTVANAEPSGVEPGQVAYSADELAALRQAGRPVFVELTAAWCISCKVNERVALSGEGFAQALDEGDIVYMVGDWTRRDPAITALLQEHGRAGVPLYLVYPAGGGAPQILPQVLTERLVVDALRAAA
ncbi:MAG: protein-disulfide reductase DsbD family protein [Geminicoccaceae bacterium]